MSDLFQRLKSDFQDEDYRHVYTNGLIDSKIAMQIKVLREQPGRGWTQEKLAQKTGMRQARISALEDVNYSAWSLSTLRRFARAFDLYVDVEFKEFGTLERQLDGLDREHLARRSFKEDPVFNQDVATALAAATATRDFIVSASATQNWAQETNISLYDRLANTYVVGAAVGKTGLYQQSAVIERISGSVFFVPQEREDQIKQEWTPLRSTGKIPISVKNTIVKEEIAA